MNLIAFSIRTKGFHNFARRLHTVFTRFRFSEIRTRRALYMIIDSLRRHNSAPTFFVPAVVLGRHASLVAEIAHNGAEIGIHGYVHNDYRTLNKDQQFKQTRQAMAVFQHVKIPFYGFRNPYLGWTSESLDVFATLGFHYESNIAILHDVVDLDAFPPLLRSGFAKSLKLFQAIPCTAYALRPHFAGDLLRIPTSIPDDEMLFDRLRVTNPVDVGHTWSRIMQRVYDLEGLYTLNLHPERGILCKPALDLLLTYARGRPLPVWIARIGEIAHWWKERSQFRLRITPLGGGRWQVKASDTPRATILARYLTVEDQEIRPWHGKDLQVCSPCFTVRAATCPGIAVSQQTSEEVVKFLYEQGYLVTRCSPEEAQRYTLQLDRPEGLGITSGEQAENASKLVEEIESLERPLIRFGCWPGGCRAALAISGDIDSVTVQDFFLRIVEVFRNK